LLLLLPRGLAISRHQHPTVCVFLLSASAWHLVHRPAATGIGINGLQPLLLLLPLLPYTILGTHPGLSPDLITQFVVYARIQT
jgi:hypothetical protein